MAYWTHFVYMWLAPLVDIREILCTVRSHIIIVIVAIAVILVS